MPKPLPIDDDEREWVSLGGDLEASYDGARCVDVRVKGSGKRLFLSWANTVNLLHVFARGIEREHERAMRMMGVKTE